MSASPAQEQSVKTLTQEELLAQHYHLHQMYNGAPASMMSEIEQNHEELVQELRSRDIIHHLMDDLDKALVDREGEMKTQGQDPPYSAGLSLDKIEKLAGVSKHLKGKKVLFVGAKAGELAAPMIMSGFKVDVTETDPQLAYMASQKSNLLKGTHLDVLKGLSASAYDTVLTINHLNELKSDLDLEETIKQSYRVSKERSVHLVSLGMKQSEGSRRFLSDLDLAGQIKSAVPEAPLRVFQDLSNFNVLAVLDKSVSEQSAPYYSLNDMTLVPGFVSLIESDGVKVLVKSSEPTPFLEDMILDQLESMGYKGEVKFLYDKSYLKAQTPVFDLVCKAHDNMVEIDYEGHINRQLADAAKRAKDSGFWPFIKTTANNIFRALFEKEKSMRVLSKGDNGMYLFVYNGPEIKTTSVLFISDGKQKCFEFFSPTFESVQDIKERFKSGDVFVGRYVGEKPDNKVSEIVFSGTYEIDWSDTDSDWHTLSMKTSHGPRVTLFEHLKQQNQFLMKFMGEPDGSEQSPG